MGFTPGPGMYPDVAVLRSPINEQVGGGASVKRYGDPVTVHCKFEWMRGSAYTMALQKNSTLVARLYVSVPLPCPISKNSLIEYNDDQFYVDSVMKHTARAPHYAEVTLRREE